MVTAIPYHVEINRVIELLASQIYQSPLALLRENCQNAYDAILERLWMDPHFAAPQISVEIGKHMIRIIDNGIGMSPQDLDSHYWRAGSSGKNNPESRAAGVVGTFGIGAMANFGVASKLVVTTESLKTGERTTSSVLRDQLSATEPCITIEPLASEGNPGTMIDIYLDEEAGVDIQEATAYVTEAVKYLAIPVLVNGEPVSGDTFLDAVSLPVASEVQACERMTITGGLEATVTLSTGLNGEPWIRVTDIKDGDDSIDGEVILAQDLHQIHAYRSGFSLAVAGVQSYFGLGGIANLTSLSPTAGREALTTSSIQFLQNLVTGLERLIAERLSRVPAADNSTKFMSWVKAHSRFDLCNLIKIQLEPGLTYVDLYTFSQSESDKTWNMYSGSDSSLIESYATEEQPLIVLSRTRPRRDCQEGYLRSFGNINSVADRPTVLGTKSESKWSLGESALAFRLSAILESDYFVPSIVEYGRVSHGLPLIVDTSKNPVKITLDSDSSTIAPILELYEIDYEALTGFVKDFIRNAIFPKISRLVPSSSRDGAAAFLKTIRRPRDVFEYEHADLGSLGEIWHEYVEGRITMVEAARQSASIVQSTVQVLDPSSASSVEEILSDVVANDRMMSDVDVGDDLAALPAITRPSVESNAKLLLVGDGEDKLRGYSGFLAITERSRRENTDFFLQPHRTELVWGGQKALYIFQHHSGEFGLYYELQGQEVFPSGPGSCRIPTCTIIVKDQVYIPVPDIVLSAFRLGPGEKKSFEVRNDLLFPEPP